MHIIKYNLDMQNKLFINTLLYDIYVNKNYTFIN